MLMLSISSTEAMPTPHAAHLVSLEYKASRFSSGKFLLSSIPRGNLSRSRMQAAATTGPASGAQPASSTPASGCGKSSSSLKEQRRGIESHHVPLRTQGSRPTSLNNQQKRDWAPAFAGARGQSGSIRQGGKRRFSPAL